MLTGFAAEPLALGLGPALGAQAATTPAAATDWRNRLRETTTSRSIGASPFEQRLTIDQPPLAVAVRLALCPPCVLRRSDDAHIAGWGPLERRRRDDPVRFHRFLARVAIPVRPRALVGDGVACPEEVERPLDVDLVRALHDVAALLALVYEGRGLGRGARWDVQIDHLERTVEVGCEQLVDGAVTRHAVVRVEATALILAHDGGDDVLPVRPQLDQSCDRDAERVGDPHQRREGRITETALELAERAKTAATS